MNLCCLPYNNLQRALGVSLLMRCYLDVSPNATLILQSSTRNACSDVLPGDVTGRLLISRAGLITRRPRDKELIASVAEMLFRLRRLIVS